MTTTTLMYDDPQYTVHQNQSFACAAGANAVSVNKFVAYTSTIIKSAQATVVTAGTSAAAGNAIIVKAITATGTTTTALATLTLGSSTAGVTTNVAITTTTLAAGETLTFTNGTDATGVAAVAVEYVIAPNAAVTL